jgi:putative nucleotidyltransferase with HDIG domain
VNLWEQLERSANVPPARGAQALHHGRRALLAAALAVLTYLLFPAAPAAEFPLLDVGTVASDDVIAPFAFRVPKAEEDVRRERDAAAGAALPVLTATPAAADSARLALRQFAGAVAPGADSTLPVPVRAARVAAAAAARGVRLDSAEAAYLSVPGRTRALTAVLDTVFSRWVARGVASNAALNGLSGEVTLRGPSTDRDVRVDAVLTCTRLVPLAQQLRRPTGPPVADTLYLKLLGAFFRPTLEIDRVATERRREQARATVDPDRFVVRAGEKIVGAHEVVGREEYDKMRTARDELQGRRGTERQFSRVAGAVLFNLLVIALFGVTLWLFRPQLYASMRALLVTAACFVAVLVAATVIARADTVRPELIPVALAAVVLSVLFDARISLIATMILAVLVGGQGAFRGTSALFVMLIGGAAAAISGRVIRRRTDVFYPVATIAAGYALTSLAMGLTLGWSLDTIARSAGWGALNAVVSLAVALVLLPVAEEATGIDTYPKLLEWSDLNRPLMRRLSLEAPGTYNHTVVMANLAEAACNAIGANGLLARVGAYYHDIGKLKKPQYFVENQPKGRNPHDKLKPGTSAAIIRNHVREGIELAEEFRVPKAVRAFIAEHHGTGAITYFLERAKERDGPPQNPAEFAYPGPVPQTVETAVCMLADGVEAAARVLNEPTPQKIREVIDHIVRQRMDQGQLRDAPLTLKQLEVVKEQFARLLIGQYHNRIDYPASSGGVTAEFAAIPGGAS